MGIVSSVLSSIIEGLINSVIGWLQGYLDKRAAVQQGQAQRAAAEMVVSEKTETVIAQAEADAPKTEAGVEGRLKDGTF